MNNYYNIDKYRNEAAEFRKFRNNDNVELKYNKFEKLMGSGKEALQLKQKFLKMLLSS